MLWFRSSPPSDRDADTRPLLADYDAVTTLQCKAAAKLHTYQMLRAVSKGYYPSTEQLVVHLRTLLSADVLRPANAQLSADGRRLVRHMRRLIEEFIEFLRDKNSEDQIQEFLWCVTRARVELDVGDIMQMAGRARGGANVGVAYGSLHTVFDLLLANSDFRKLLADLTTITRQVFADTAATSVHVVQTVAETVEPSDAELVAISSKAPASENEDFGEVPAKEVGEVIAEGAVETATQAVASADRELNKAGRKDALVERMKMVVMRLRQNMDYTQSVSLLSVLLKRYARTYSRALDVATTAVVEDIEPNPALDGAIKSFWSFVKSFGDRFENAMEDVGNSVQALLTDPDFIVCADEKIAAIRERVRGIGTKGTLRGDIDDAFGQAQRVFTSTLNDKDISNLLRTSATIANTLFPSATHPTNPELITDFFNVFLPLAIQSIQYIPIPRLTISTPSIDLLLENLILEPGETINDSSFLPFRMRIETQNALEIRKGRCRACSSITSLATIKLDGISLRAEDVGYWLRAHHGSIIPGFTDAGLASFSIDKRGIDLHLDVEIAKDRISSILSLRGVHVQIHNLNYTLRQSRFSFLSWLFKPLLRRLVRRALERAIAENVKAALEFADREILFARERLRATRIAQPRDLATFVRAVMARLRPEPDPDVEVGIGVLPGRGEKKVFQGRRTPGSLVHLWEEEGERAGEIVDEGAVGGWRNEVFDLHVRSLE
ncbi:unnamed protein product [Tuber melanosporum]|uniref:(Perigord truffle) hypothetical protein n=1 Tax=Tuber melanosporum (strain Mel28) TaxID=656061 RepID=D5GNM2_TUBMM|nr:uncharacterized protein GSTUM_00011371001 [Tuber melanosporum]CAZ86115.1 unnamed protein product [Tuber melanosporum]